MTVDKCRFASGEARRFAHLELGQLKIRGVRIDWLNPRDRWSLPLSHKQKRAYNRQYDSPGDEPRR